MTKRLHIRNARIFDPITGGYRDESEMLIVDGIIAELGPPQAIGDAQDLDLHGSVVMPGLIDSHVHVTAATADLASLARWGANYVGAHAARTMEVMLNRGFTTVRDAGGADHGLARAQQEGLIRGPRLIYCGKALSQTGGHGDFRAPGETKLENNHCCGGLARVVDGPDAMRVAVRDEFRKGAGFIKVMASGGVASPNDPIDSTQYARTELEVAVEEAEAAESYVAAHAYGARAVNRALRAGVRSIEHGNLIDEESIKLLLETNAYLVPTLVTYWALKEVGLDNNLPRDSWEKVDHVLGLGVESFERAAQAGVRIAFGSDLLGGMHCYQSREFRIRAEVRPWLEVVQSATIEGAALVGMPGKIGTTAIGAHADLIVLNDDVLAGPHMLAEPERHLEVVIQSGRIVEESVR